ncbi:MAG: lysoplasmalogenase [Fermentimonas sp.]
MNKKVENHYGWICLLLLIQLIFAVLALLGYGFVFRSGTAGVAILVFLLLSLNRQLPVKEAVPLIFAFLCSICGDWFLSHRYGESIRFIYGVACFFFAHVGFLWYALLRGNARWKFTAILLAAYLLFYFLMLYPNFADKATMFAVLAYLIVSGISMGAAVGVRGNRISRLTFAVGVGLLLFSDTIIGLREFTGYTSLGKLILPTYYLCHIFITYSVIARFRCMGN